MGIERFFSSTEKNDITNFENSFTYKLQTRLSFSYLTIDFNSIAHITSSTVIEDMNYLLYQIINKTYKTNKVSKLITTYNLDLDTKKDLSISDLKKVISNTKLDLIIIEKIKESIINIITNFINSDQLKYILIASDGVPHKSKMIEQKNRRYMGVIISELKKKIFNKYEKDLLKDQKRYQYETNKFIWSKIYISPGTEFMCNLDKILSSETFTNTIFGLCKNLKEYMYSGTDEFGEGEKKIIDYLYNHSKNIKKDNIAVYSPDSDMTLLCLILSSYIDNIKILRHNKQDNNYDIIDIDILKCNIYKYVVNNSIKDEQKDNIKLNSSQIINDIVFILSVLGNDFIPKIESINIKYDFNKIIDKYIKLLDSEKQYIIKDNTINYNIFLQLIKVLHFEEGKNLQKTYVIANYQNYNKLKKIMNTTDDNFNYDMAEFLDKLRMFNTHIKQQLINIDKWLNTPFIDKLIQFTLLDKTTINHREFIDTYIDYYKKNNKLPEIKIILKKYSKNISNPFYKTKLEKIHNHIDPNLKITKYDTEVFKLDNILDEYIMRLNATSLRLGFVCIDPVTYVWKTEPIKDGVQKFYNNFFGINNIDVANQNMSELLEEYIQGLIWVFNYYFNSYNDQTANIWFYKHTHAPLLTQLYYFLRNKDQTYINDIIKNLNKYRVKQNIFFKPKEHLMFVSPIKIYPNIIPKGYENKTKTKESYIIDIEKIINNIWQNEISDEIDCRGIIFLNKCHVKAIKIEDNIFESHKKDLKFISYLNS